MKHIFSAVISAAVFFSSLQASFASFDERLWENYAEIKTSGEQKRGLPAGLYLDPGLIGDRPETNPFSDLRVLTSQKVEVPRLIVSLKSESRVDPVRAAMRNLSKTKNGETWVELHFEKSGRAVNAVEIDTTDVGFSLQTQVLGSNDGKQWNIIRSDGVIFDVAHGEKIRLTRISFPESTFSMLAMKIADNKGRSLKITGVRAFRVNDVKGQSYEIPATIGPARVDAARKESSIVVHMDRIFPIDRLHIKVPEKNFRRYVEVQTKKNGDWVHWGQGVIFNFETPDMHEANTTIEIPEVSSAEFRLVFGNLDSPPLPVTGISGEGARRLLVFRMQDDGRHYLFWGNPKAGEPQYDLAGLMERQKPENIPVFALEKTMRNDRFEGDKARIPFTERHKYALSAVVMLTIAGLMLLQYRVFKNTEK